MQSGSIVVVLSDDGSGGWQADTWFTPDGGGQAMHIDGPTPVSLGDAITISPSCVECDLATTVNVGPADSNTRPAPAVKTVAAKGPAPTRATKPGPAAPGPHGPHGR